MRGALCEPRREASAQPFRVVPALWSPAACCPAGAEALGAITIPGTLPSPKRHTCPGVERPASLKALPLALSIVELNLI